MTFIRRWLLVVSLLGVPLAVLVVLRATPAIDRRWYSPDGHLVVVAGIALCALIVQSSRCLPHFVSRIQGSCGWAWAARL